MTRVGGKVGCDMDQKKPKGAEDIQVLFTSLTVLGTSRERKEVRTIPSSILENHHQALWDFCRKERREENEEKEKEERREHWGERKVSGTLSRRE